MRMYIRYVHRQLYAMWTLGVVAFLPPEVKDAEMLRV